MWSTTGPLLGAIFCTYISMTFPQGGVWCCSWSKTGLVYNVGNLVHASRASYIKFIINLYELTCVYAYIAEGHLTANICKCILKKNVGSLARPRPFRYRCSLDSMLSFPIAVTLIYMCSYFQYKGTELGTNSCLCYGGKGEVPVRLSYHFCLSLPLLDWQSNTSRTQMLSRMSRVKALFVARQICRDRQQSTCSSAHMDELLTSTNWCMSTFIKELHRMLTQYIYSDK